MIEMKKHYIGTKHVTAELVTEVDTDKKYYLVQFNGECENPIPKEEFEAAYVSLGEIGHLPPYQQRVLGERAELAVKVTALGAFTKSVAFEAVPGHEQQRLKIQLDAMNIYHDVLMDRIAAF